MERKASYKFFTLPHLVFGDGMLGRDRANV